MRGMRQSGKSFGRISRLLNMHFLMDVGTVVMFLFRWDDASCLFPLDWACTVLTVRITILDRVKNED
jgi:hypothetical protein